MPRPTATWNSARGAWEKPETQTPLFRLCEHSALYSEILPTSGSMRAGRLYARPMSAHPTSVSGSSSSRGPLLKTPTSQLAVNGGSQHPDKRRSGGHGPTLADEVEHLLPTPMASDGGPRGSSAGFGLRNEVKTLLPTPRATDGEKGGPNQRGSSGDLMLPSAVAHLLPTARARDWKRGGKDGLEEALLPTPMSADGDRASLTMPNGNPTLRGALTNPPSGAGSAPSDDPRPGQLTIEDA